MQQKALIQVLVDDRKWTGYREFGHDLLTIILQYFEFYKQRSVEIWQEIHSFLIKYSETCQTREKILKALGTDAVYYQGETSDGPDQTYLTTNAIKNKGGKHG